MRKQMRRGIAAGLACIMVLGALSGCGKKATPENLLTDMSKNVKKIESAASNIKMDVSMTQGSEAMSMTFDMDMENIKDPAATHAKGDITMDVSGTDINTEMELYQVKEDKKIVTYNCVMDQWTKNTEEESEDALDTEMFGDITKMADSFKKKDKLVDVNGKECFELNGDISWDAVAGLIDEDMMNSVGVGDLLDSDELKDVKIPCTLDIYKSDILPARISMDMKDVLDGIYEGQNLGITIDAYSFEITYKEFDKVKKIKVPDEVKKAAGDSGSSDDSAADDSTKKKTTQKAEQSGELGGSWDSYTVQVNDKVVTLPCTLEDISAAGLKLDTAYTPENYMINAGEYELAYFQDDKGNEIMVDVINNSDEAMELKDCMVGGISVDRYQLEAGGMTVIFPGGVQMGTAMEDVISAYGETEDIYEGDSVHMYTWTDASSYYKSCEIDFDPATGKVMSMSLDCYE